MSFLRPGPALAALFALGIVLADPQGPVGLAPLILTGPFLRWIIAALLILLVRISLARPTPSPRGGEIGRIVVVGLLAVGLGALRAALADRGSPEGPDLPDGPVRVEAWVTEVPVAIPGRPAQGPAGTQPPSGPRTVFSTEDPELRVVIEGTAPSIAPGQLLSLDGRILPPQGPGNPGDFRPKGAPVLLLNHPENARAIDYRPFRRLIQDPVLAVRERAMRLIEELYPAETRGFLIAMLLGDRRLLNDDHRKSMARTGTIHFLAISGLNVGMAMALVIRLPLPRRLRLPARLLFLLVFTLVTGAAPPVVRAAVMLAIYSAVEAFGRSPRPLDTLGWSALVILAIEPWWAFDLGFQLSLAAVFALIAWAPPLLGDAGNDPEAALKKRLAPRAQKPRGRWALAGALIRGWSRSAQRALIISMACSAGTTPLIFYSFCRIHPLGPIWNLLVGPIVNLVLLGGGASIALAAIHPALGVPAAWLTHLLSEVLLWALGLFAQVPGSCIYLPPPPAWAAAASQALIVLGAAPALRRPALIAGALLTIVLGGAAAFAHRPPELRVLDVGGGSCALLTVPGAGSYLFDCGTGGSRPGAGERIARTLLFSGVRRLDGAVLSHPHADHVGAILELSEIIPIDRVWISPLFEEFPLGQWVADQLESRRIPIERVANGRRILTPGDLVLEILHPPNEDPFLRDAGPNDGSLVVRALFEKTAVLVPGDIEEKGTARLLAGGDDIRSDLVIVPHHGRSNDFLPELFKRVNPTLAVIGGDGEGGGKAQAESLRKQGIAVAATWEHGAVIVSFKEGRFQIQPR